VIIAALLIWGAAAVPAPAAASSAAVLYRIDLAGNAIIWSQDRPQGSGALLVFHRHPDGILMSVRSSDVRRIAVARRESERFVAKKLVPGEQVDIGPTGSGSKVASAPAASSRGGAKAPLGLGERKDGTAALNPDRAYRPDWDSKQVPGLNMGLPNSPNDYREGRTLGYPSAPSAPVAPGDLPRPPVESADPKASNQ
jgi:hypothetical protein